MLKDKIRYAEQEGEIICFLPLPDNSREIVTPCEGYGKPSPDLLDVLIFLHFRCGDYIFAFEHNAQDYSKQINKPYETIRRMKLVARQMYSNEQDKFVFITAKQPDE
jgi:hypothetical protein